MNKDFNVVFLVGSITEGGGSSNYKNSYVNLLGNFLKETYSDYNINIINLGASGTGSNFGLFRLERDVISYKPNLVFVEFAVNDRICNPKEVSINMEGIVRSLLKLDVQPVIIFLVTPTEMSDACGDVHKKIAYYYNIPVVDIQDYIWREIGKEKILWNDVACDSLHPNDLDLYSKTSSNFVTAINLRNLQDTDHSLVLRVSEKRNPNSSGNKIIIGDFILDR